MAHDVNVALRYVPGGAEAPPPDRFGANREREGAALGAILKVHGMGHPTLGRWLSRIPNETLVVWGEHDRTLPASQVPAWADRVPRAQVLIARDAGHLAMQEQPSCVAAIEDFLAADRRTGPRPASTERPGPAASGTEVAPGARAPGTGADHLRRGTT